MTIVVFKMLERVHLARDNQAFVMYCVYGVPGSFLLTINHENIACLKRLRLRVSTHIRKHFVMQYTWMMQSHFEMSPKRNLLNTNWVKN